jgi:hypothetical protein
LIPQSSWRRRWWPFWTYPWQKTTQQQVKTQARVKH